MKYFYSIAFAISATLLSGCARPSFYQLEKISAEEAFSDIRALEEEKSQPHSESESLYTQPVNKSVPCKVVTSQDQLDRKNFRAYWDGECKDGFVYGLGRDIAISDTHHVEEIAIYGDNGKIQGPAVQYNFVNQGVAYYSIDNNRLKQGFVEQIINNEREFNIQYSSFVDSGNASYQSTWSPFSPDFILEKYSKNVRYIFSGLSTTKHVRNNARILIFQTLDQKTNSPIGFEASHLSRDS